MTKRAILLEALKSTPMDIERIVRPVGEATEAGTIRDIVGHLAYAEGQYAVWIARAMAEDEPSLSLTERGAVFDRPMASLQTLVSQFRDGRAQMIALLSGLNPGEWQRRVTLDGHRTTLRFLIQGIVEHDIEQTNRLVEAVHAHRSATKQRAAETERE